MNPYIKPNLPFIGLYLQIMYTILRNFLFFFGPEKVHYFSMNALKLACKIPFLKQLIAKNFTPVATEANFVAKWQVENYSGFGCYWSKIFGD